MKILLWVIVAIVIIGGGYWLYASGMFGGSGEMMNENATSTSQTQTSGSIKDLIARGSSQCQVTDPTNGSSGTVYVGNGEMRGDFTSQTSSGTVASHMISDGHNVYVWSSAAPQGMKMTVSSEASSSSSASTQDPYNESVNYTCTAWNVDASEFALPTGVTFEDMNAMMQGSAGASSNTAQCSACEQAPNAAAKAQCRAALKCQ